MKNVLAACARPTFMPARKGRLAKIRADELMADMVRALVMRACIRPGDIEGSILDFAFLPDLQRSPAFGAVEQHHANL